MKNKYSVILAICFLVSLVFLVANQGQNPQWKGTIEEEDGIKVIKNHSEPLYGEIEFVLEEDLSIGSNKDENYLFFRGIDFVVNNNEDILILDIGNCRIQIFDKDGKYLSTIGRKGQGPGEFINPFDIQLDSNNNIYVQDSRKIHVFNNHGNFERSVQLETDFGSFPRDSSLESFGIREDGNFWENIYSPIPDIGTMDVVIINSDGKLIKKIASLPAQRFSLINGRRLFLYNPYFSYLYFCPVNPSAGIYGIASEYRLFISDLSGKTLRVIEKDNTPKSISREERKYIIDTKIENLKKQNVDINISSNEAEKLLDFKKERPYYNGILRDENGNLYIKKV